LFTIGIARASGAAIVLAADRTPFRLGLAAKMGAHAAVNVQEVDDTVAWFREHNEGYGFDVVFEMSGAPDAIASAFLIARNGGRVILFGIPSRPVEIDVAESLIFKNLDVLAVNGRRIFATWYKTRWLLESGVVDLRPLITDEIELSDFEQAFAKLQAGEACKIVMYPNGRPAAPQASEQPEREPVAVTSGPRPWAHRSNRSSCSLPCAERPVRSLNPRAPTRASEAAHERPRRAATGGAGQPAGGGDLQAVQHAVLAAGAARSDGGSRRGARAVVEQLPRPRRSARGGRGRDRRAAALRRRHGLGPVHLRHLRAPSRAGA